MPETLDKAVNLWTQVQDAFGESRDARRESNLKEFGQSTQFDELNTYLDAEEEVLVGVCYGLKRLAAQESLSRVPDSALDLVGGLAIRSLSIWQELYIAEGSQEHREAKALEDCRALATEVTSLLSNDCDEMISLCERHSAFKRSESLKIENRGPVPLQEPQERELADLRNAVDREVLATNLEAAQGLQEMVVIINEATEGKFRRLKARHSNLSSLLEFGPIVAGAAVEHWLVSAPGLSSVRELIVAWVVSKLALPKLEAHYVNKKRIAVQQSLLILPLLLIPSAAICLAYFRRELDQERAMVWSLLAQDEGAG